MACPVPVARTAQAIEALERGEVLEVLATDPDADLDVRAWALHAGHEVVSMTQGEDAVLVFRVRHA